MPVWISGAWKLYISVDKFKRLKNKEENFVPITRWTKIQRHQKYRNRGHCSIIVTLEPPSLLLYLSFSLSLPFLVPLPFSLPSFLAAPLPSPCMADQGKRCGQSGSRMAGRGCLASLSASASPSGCLSSATQIKSIVNLRVVREDPFAYSKEYHEFLCPKKYV